MINFLLPAMNWIATKQKIMLLNGNRGKKIQLRAIIQTKWHFLSVSCHFLLLSFFSELWQWVYALSFKSLQQENLVIIYDGLEIVFCLFLDFFFARSRLEYDTAESNSISPTCVIPPIFFSTLQCSRIPCILCEWACVCLSREFSKHCAKSLTREQKKWQTIYSQDNDVEIRLQIDFASLNSLNRIFLS